MLLLSLTHWKC